MERLTPAALFKRSTVARHRNHPDPLCRL